MINSNDNWIEGGKYQGRHIKRCEQAVSDISEYYLTVTSVLEATNGNSQLLPMLVNKSMIEDIRHDRIGLDWTEERNAMAHNTIESFIEKWSSIKTRLVENHVVALVSALEQYIKSLLVEFSQQQSMTIENLDAYSDTSDRDWLAADDAYSKSQRIHKSTSKSWLHLCDGTSIPNEVKNQLRKWGADSINTEAIDEMSLIRNIIVHRAGLPNSKDVKRLKSLQASEGKAIESLSTRLQFYSNSYWSFINSIDPCL